MNVGNKITALLFCASLCFAPLSAHKSSETVTKYDKITAAVQIAALAAHYAGLSFIGSGIYGAYTSGLDQTVIHKVLSGLCLCAGSAILYTKARPWVRSAEKLFK